MAEETVSGSEKREARQERKVAWHCAMLSGQRRKLARAHLETVMEECQASGRATVDHLVLHVQQMCGYDTRYRSLGSTGTGWPCCLALPTCCAHSPVGCDPHGMHGSGDQQADTTPTTEQG